MVMKISFLIFCYKSVFRRDRNRRRAIHISPALEVSKLVSDPSTGHAALSLCLQRTGLERLHLMLDYTKDRSQCYIIES